MIRKEQFAFGAALVSSSLTFILSQSLAWAILILGLGLIADFYLRDLIWGADRLTKEQILEIPAEEYKKRVLGNPKTERWVNFRFSGYDAFKKQMRKLAREAVIFMLLTPLVFIAGRFAFLYHDTHKPPTTVVLDMSKSVPIPCKDGEEYIEQGKLIWSCQNGIRTAVNIPAPPLGFAPVIANGIDLSAGLVPKPTLPSTLDLLITALWFGLYGVPGGFGLWILYRAIYFAIKG